jgi:hypothetical protein
LRNILKLIVEDNRATSSLRCPATPGYFVEPGDCRELFQAVSGGQQLVGTNYTLCREGDRRIVMANDGRGEVLRLTGQEVERMALAEQDVMLLQQAKERWLMTIPDCHPPPKLKLRALQPSSLFFASIWEIAIKANIGKLTLSVPFETLHLNLVTTGITLLPITFADTKTCLALPLHHRDPFDRIMNCPSHESCPCSYQSRFKRRES